MQTKPAAATRLRPVLAGLVLIAALTLTACKEVETEEATGYSPSKLEAIKGNDDVKRVVFTAEGARRTGLRTEPIRRSGGHRVVRYAALVYGPEGETYVYTSPKPLFYVRKEVDVARIEGNRVLLANGPPPGTKVVTVGTAEVYGTELEVDEH